ncbi:hypothetical protein [Pseudomonas moraviensis]|jgi:hypothetical protein|uniref:hypothetical protein n=1 Tax=Pseudomonas moraviensis TaxID=321662 RepID=UPI00080EBA43|nr:hypothetical protein [Pseudomonas moraviensis]
MKFKSLQFFARHAAGWASEELHFGQAITQLYAKNGSGKTPLVQSIMFCLGLDVQFREDIVRNCSQVKLKIELNGKLLTFERRIGEKFTLFISSEGSRLEEFYNEEELSSYMLKTLGLRADRLITTGDAPTIPYFSALLPLFYLDQDKGYSDFYVPARQGFIKSQYSEMVRLAVGLPPQSSYDKKKKTIDLNREIEHLDRSIVDSDRLRTRLKQDLPSTIRPIPVLDHLISEAKSRLDELKNAKDIKSETISSFDHLISNLRRQHHELSTKQIYLESKIKSSAQISREIESEIETLNLNEEAGRAFTSFSDICSSKSCGMFLASSESYGKSLLYLRDQLKDLETANVANMQQSESLGLQKTIIERQISELAQKRGLAEREAGIEMFIVAISKIASEVFELELEKGKLQKLEIQNTRHIELEKQRNNALTSKESLDTVREQSPELLQFKIELSEKMAAWLDVLSSKNINRSIRIDSDLKPILGTEKLDIIKGSSKARSVLAFHAALFEICTSDPSSPFRTLIFDTPRQQEVHWEDMDEYFKALKEIAVKNDAQIIFSTTSYRYEIDSKIDKEWLPPFEGFEQPMYLGRLN